MRVDILSMRMIELKTINVRTDTFAYRVVLLPNNKLDVSLTVNKDYKQLFFTKTYF